MLGMLTAALALTTSAQTNGPTLTATIHPWSTARFIVSANGEEILRLERNKKIDLGRYLRPGSNTIEVRYRTNDGKPSRTQPAILSIETQDGSRRATPLRIVASEDNPRGHVRIELAAS